MRMLWEMRRVVVIFLIALGVGGIAGYFSRSSAKVVREVEMKRSVREEAPAEKSWGAEDFLKASMGNRVLTDQLSDWSIDELRAALDGSARSPDAFFEMTLGSAVERALLAEWMRRDFEGALGWFEALESDYVKARLLSTLSGGWPKERGLEGIDFVLNHRELYFPNGRASPWQILATGISKAAEGGPAAVNEVLRRLRENDGDLDSLGRLDFPPGFDFHTFIGGDEFAHVYEEKKGFRFAEAWSLEDPEGAIGWLLGQHGVKAISPLATATKDGKSERRLRWLAGEMSNWSVEDQDEFLNQAASQWFRAPEAPLLMAESAKDPAMAEKIRATGIQSMYRGSVGSGLKLLGAIPEPARRIELLMEAEPQARRAEGDPGRLGPQGEITLRAKLREWNATEAQTETIIQRFKK